MARKSGWIGITSDGREGEGATVARRLPSPSSMWPSSSRPLRMQTTSRGALSASSMMMTLPYLQALTRGESAKVNLPSIRVGATVSACTVVSLCSWIYSLSIRRTPQRRSAILFFPTPWLPMRSRCLSPALISFRISCNTRTCCAMSKKTTLGTRARFLGCRIATWTPPMSTMPSSSRACMVRPSQPLGFDPSRSSVVSLRPPQTLLSKDFLTWEGRKAVIQVLLISGTSPSSYAPSLLVILST
mmetsp:Transcript_49933/g.119692  ORF Transcript_49933/g.119692 Transcript_49933/m.119692 type:complete len:244 (+) Transcript_49933:2-733(+)